MNANKEIRFTQISKSFDQGKSILDQTEVTLEQGKCLILSGKNGSGKSTLMRIMAGLVQPDTATIHYNQCTASWKKSQKILRKQMMYLYQEPYMFDGTVKRNLSYALESQSTNKLQREDKIKQALDWADLLHRENTQAKHLSGGEKQRLALAQAWLKQPHFLLLDEPTANMDMHAKQRTGKLLAEFKILNIGLLIASHDLNHLLPIMNQRLVLQDGKLINSVTL